MIKCKGGEALHSPMISPQCLVSHWATDCDIHNGLSSFQSVYLFFSCLFKPFVKQKDSRWLELGDSLPAHGLGSGETYVSYSG